MGYIVFNFIFENISIYFNLYIKICVIIIIKQKKKQRLKKPITCVSFSFYLVLIAWSISPKSIYQQKDLHYSSAYGGILFPSIFEPKSILEKTENFISDNPDLPKLCKKELVENCDHLKRRIPILESQL